MNIYEADKEMELKILRGLLENKLFLKQFIDMEVTPDIFYSDDGEFIRLITSHLVDYFNHYTEIMSVGNIIKSIEMDMLKKDDDERKLILSKVKRILTDTLSTPIKPVELPYLLDSQIEHYRDFQIINNAKELDRFYSCHFDHGKHDRCKGCPFWVKCKYLSGTTKHFSEKIFFMQDLMRSNLLAATGEDKTIKAVGSDSMRGSLDRYKKKAEERKSKGDEFTFGIPTPWPTITKLLDGFQNTELYGIFAPTKKGKTICTINITATAIKAGKNVQIFAMEDTKETWIDKFFCHLAGVEWDDFRKAKLSDIDFKTLMKVQEEFEEGWKNKTIGEVYQYHRPINNIGIKEVQAELEMHKANGHRIDMFIFDHLHIAKKPYDRELTRDDLRINRIAEKFKEFATEHDCVALCAHQLTTSGARKHEARGSDSLNDCFDAVWHLLEPREGHLVLQSKVFRNGKDHSIDLENYRNIVSLPESVKTVSTITGEGLAIPDEEWLGD